jgi:hypothetical protein
LTFRNRESDHQSYMVSIGPLRLKSPWYMLILLVIAGHIHILRPGYSQLIRKLWSLVPCVSRRGQPFRLG